MDMQIFRDVNGDYCIRYFGRELMDIRRQFGFGTDCLPCAFLKPADPYLVLEEIRRLNPGKDVQLHPSIEGIEP